DIQSPNLCSLSKLEESDVVASGIHAQRNIVDGVHGQCSGQVYGDGGGSLSWSEAGGCFGGLARGNNLGARQESRIQERDFVAVRVEGQRGIGERLESHSGSADFVGR